jgi:hypothetical protein
MQASFDALLPRPGPFPALSPNDVNLWLIRELDGIKDSLKDQAAATERTNQKLDGMAHSAQSQGASMERKFESLEKSIREVQISLEKSIREEQTSSEKSIREVQISLEKSIREVQTSSDRNFEEGKTTLTWLGLGGVGVLAILQFVLSFRNEVAPFLKSL